MTRGDAKEPASIAARSVKLIFLNRFFHPDHSATSQMLSDLAFALAGRGRAVSVITSRQRYDAPEARLPSQEVIDGVIVHRVWTSRFGRNRLLGRALDYASFYLAAAWRLWRLTAAGAVVVAKTDPPMLSLIAAPICWLRGARLVNWLQDIFPETAQALGLGGRPAAVAYGMMRRLRDASLMSAHMNVVLGERMARYVRELGIPAARIRIIANWADGTTITPIDRSANPLRERWNLGNACVVGYSGNLGRVHEIETILDAMMSLERSHSQENTPSARVLWLFCGGGVLLERLRSEVTLRNLKSVRFEPYQPRDALSQSLSAADVHLVSLRPAFEGLIVPSKVYGICAAARPTIFIGAQDGEIAQLIERCGCGRTVVAGDGTGLAQTIAKLAADPAGCRQMGQRARQALDSEFDKSIAVARWDELLFAGMAAAGPSRRSTRSPES